MFLTKIFLNILRTCPKNSIQLSHRRELRILQCVPCVTIYTYNTDILSLRNGGITCCMTEILYLERTAWAFVSAFVLNFTQYGLSLSPLLVRLFLRINGSKFCCKVGREKSEEQ
jgi:hypothetical protein